MRIFAQGSESAEAEEKSSSKDLCQPSWVVGFKKGRGRCFAQPRQKNYRAGYASVEKDLCKGYLIVISAKPDINGKKSTVIGKELKYAFEKLGILPEKNDFRDEVK